MKLFKVTSDCTLRAQKATLLLKNMQVNSTANGTQSPSLGTTRQTVVPGKRVVGEATALPLTAPTKWIHWLSSIVSTSDINPTTFLEHPSIASTEVSKAVSVPFGNRSTVGYPTISPAFGYEDPSIGARVFTGVLLFFIAVIGTIGNINVISTSRKKTGPKIPPDLKKTSNRIIVFLASIDLLGCLFNIPLTFVAVTFKPNGRLLNTLSVLHISLTQGTQLGTSACLVLMAVNRSDAIVRFQQPGRITERSLWKLILIISLLSSVVGFTTFFSTFDKPLVLWEPDLCLHSKVIPVLNLCVVFSVIASAVCAIKLYSDIKRYLKTHNKNVGLSLGVHERQQREREAKVTCLIRQFIAVFIITYGPLVTVQATYMLMSALHISTRNTDPLIAARLFLFIGHAANPIVHSGLAPKLKQVLSLSHLCVGKSEEKENKNPKKRASHVKNALEMEVMELAIHNNVMEASQQVNHLGVEGNTHKQDTSKHNTKQSRNTRQSRKGDTKESTNARAERVVVTADINPKQSGKRVSKKILYQAERIHRNEARRGDILGCPSIERATVAASFRSVVFAWPDVSHLEKSGSDSGITPVQDIK